MTKVEVNRLEPGLYKVYWKSGGSSLASVGNMRAGYSGRWLAPTNWVAPCEDQRVWQQIIRVTEIEFEVGAM